MFIEYLKAIPKCFYNQRLYNDVVTAWRGHTGIGFFTPIVIAFAVVAALVISSEAVPMFTKVSDGFIKALPGKIDFAEGKLTIDKPYPYIIRYTDFMPPEMIHESETEAAEKGEKADLSAPFIIFRENVTPEETDEYKEIILIGQDRSITKSNGKIEIHLFEKYKDYYRKDMTHDTFFSWRDSLLKYVPGFFIFFMIPFFWISYLVKSFVIAMASYLVTLTVKSDVEFGDRYRIAVFAYAPVFIIREIINSTTGFHIGFIATLLASMLYFSVILTAAKKYRPIQPVNNDKE